MKYLHLFEEYSRGEIGSNVVTIATEIKESNKTRRISVGYAIKAKSDLYIKSDGNNVAYDNMKYDYILPSCFNTHSGISLYSVMIVSYQFKRDFRRFSTEVQDSINGILHDYLYKYAYREFNPSTYDSRIIVNTGMKMFEYAISESNRENFDLNVSNVYSTISKLIANDVELDFSSVELAV